MVARSIVDKAFVPFNVTTFLYFLLDLHNERSNLLGVRPSLRLMLGKDQNVHIFDLESTERWEINAFFSDAIVKTIVRGIFFGWF